MCMKYENKYKVCFDWPFIYAHMSQGGLVPPIEEFFKEHFDIKINDISELRRRMFDLFEKLHEEKIIEPNSKESTKVCGDDFNN